MALAKVNDALERIEGLLSQVQVSRTIREGVTVAIVGRPNVGKSSLLNWVTRSDRSIVTELPGTTRDTVSESVSVQGLVVKFVDTAGLRESVDLVESLGIDRSRHVASHADHVWFVFDASTGWDNEVEMEFESLQRPPTLIGNKSDLPLGPRPSQPHVLTSTVTGEGIENLLRQLGEELWARRESLTPVVNQRHAPLLAEAQAALQEVRTVFSSNVPDDVATIGLRSAVRALGEVTGETAPPDIIERVFQDFCIGK